MSERSSSKGEYYCGAPEKGENRAIDIKSLLR